MNSSSKAANKSDAQWRDWSVGQMLQDAVRQVPERTALVVPAYPDGRHERRWTYRELQGQAERVAHALLAHFSPGDRVATWAMGSAEIVQLHLGAALAGIVLVTLNPANRATELEYLLKQSEARGLCMDRTFRKADNVAIIDALRATLPALKSVVMIDQWDAFLVDAKPLALPAVLPQDPVMLLFTSGTTGKPKGALLRHSSIVNNARLCSQRIAPLAGSAWLNMLPMFHVGGSVTMTLGCIANLGTQVLLAEFSAEGMLDALERYQVGITMAVPTMLVAALQSEKFAATDLSKLEVIVTGGTVVVPELVRAVREKFGAEVMTLFGQTEAGGAMCLTQRGDDIDRVTASVGAPLPLSEVKIISTETGAVLAAGEIGEICVRSRCAMIEYFRMPEKTRDALDADGWVHTGDLGTLREDGYVRVTGRLKDMIIRGGENIYPREIEDALAEHPGISQAAVFGVPDEKWGEQVAAAVIARPGHVLDPEALMEFLYARVARHKVPKFWHTVECLPVNASGKIQKFLLQEQYGSSASQ